MYLHWTPECADDEFLFLSVSLSSFSTRKEATCVTVAVGAVPPVAVITAVLTEGVGWKLVPVSVSVAELVDRVAAPTVTVGAATDSDTAQRRGFWLATQHS